MSMGHNVSRKDPRSSAFIRGPRSSAFIRGHCRSIALAMLAVVGVTSSAVAQADYARAERMLPWNASLLVGGDDVNPRWLLDGSRFWYRNKLAGGGAEFVLVDPARNSKAPLFDNARLAAAMSVAHDTSYDPLKLPFRDFKFADDGHNERVIEFSASRKRFSCDIGGASYSCTVSDTLPSEVPFALSPDRKWEAFVHKYNLYVRPRGGGDSIQLTTDGVRFDAYGAVDPRPSTLQFHRPQRPTVRWSPDSKKIAVMRVDERGVGLMPLIQYSLQRPKLYTWPYPLPGDTALAKPAMYVIDVPSKKAVKVELPPTEISVSLGGALRDSTWNEASTKLHFTTFDRGPKHVKLWEADPVTGAARVVLADSEPTYVELGHQYNQQNWWATEDGNTIVWWSERDGWSHLYRVDGPGKSAVQLTRGSYPDDEIIRVDEAAKRVYFTARGREPGRHPYYAALYSMNLDGSGITLLTPEDATHDVEMSPNGKWIVDTYSRIETAPTTVLRSAVDGRVVRVLEKADVSELVASGWTPARPFTVKARDGVTDIYGVMYLPTHLDSTKKYPIIDNIYPGPQVGSVGRWSWKGGGEPRAIAELGFVVVQIDHMGTPYRSKAFHDAYYGNMGDNGLPDHIAAIKQLAARHSWIDANNVGIFGHSGGGFASTDAILRYPDFFKVAVSGSGNHDNRTYGNYWAERYQGLLVRDTLRKTDNYASAANYMMAKNLKGKLMLMHGDMDDNVNPAMTIQVVDALIKANKSFDLVIAPNRNHGLNEPYFIRRRWDYFVKNLLHETPPVNYEIKQPQSGGAGSGTVAGAYDDDIP
jgi:dipeptidyl aminopeptidase/acylaminoacyl peptidase